MKTKKPSNAKTVLYPILDVGGIFSKYKKNNEFSFEEIRDKAWIENLKTEVLTKNFY